MNRADAQAWLAEIGAADCVAALYAGDTAAAAIAGLQQQAAQRGLPDWLLPCAQGGSLRELLPLLEATGGATLPDGTFWQMLVARPVLDLASAELLNGAVAVDGWDRPGVTIAPQPDGTWVLNGQIIASGHADMLIVPVHAADGTRGCALVAATLPGVQIDPLPGLDLTRQLDHAQFDSVVVAPKALIVPLARLDGSDSLSRIMARADAALCVEMVGTAQRALDIAVDHARSRLQFGKPIGSFQAIKHRCVDMLLKIENGRALAYRAVGSIDKLLPDAALEVSVAAAYCCDMAKSVCSDAVQIHGAIGFTWDHETNRLYRRALSSEALLGGASARRAALAGAIVQRDRRIEPVDPVAALDLELDPADAAFRSDLRAWLSDNPADSGTVVEQKARFAAERKWQRTLHAGGWMGVDWPVEQGGRGANLVQQVIYAYELNRVDAPGIANDVALAVAAPAIAHWGTVEQKQRYLPPMLSADEIWCQGYSERSAGSDLASLTTFAVEDSDDYLVTGGKIWTTIGHLADLCILLVRTDPASQRHRGLSCLVMDMRSPGITLLPIMQMNGEPEFAELLLDGVRIPKRNVIGAVGDGWRVALTSLGYERAGRSNAYKLDQTLRDLIAAVLRRRAAYGDTEFAIISDTIVGFYIELQALRYGEMLRLSEQLSGTEPGERSSIGKIHSSELVQRMAHCALDVLAAPALGAGDIDEAKKWQKLALTTRYYTIASGTSEVQRNILGERVLGLPKP